LSALLFRGPSFWRDKEDLVLNSIHHQEEQNHRAPYQDKKASKWQEDLTRGRRRERARQRARARLAAAWIAAFEQENLAQKREQDEKRKQVEQTAVWDQFTQTERRELELRKDGQLARLLGEPLPGELPATLQRLASEDQSQAERGLIALMSGGKTSYKYIVDLCPKDMPARIAANRLRSTWLKERRDRWLAR
jgi:hypothetical protein